jgi:hypothetical protein
LKFFARHRDSQIARRSLTAEVVPDDHDMGLLGRELNLRQFALVKQLGRRAGLLQGFQIFYSTLPCMCISNEVPEAIVEPVSPDLIVAAC